MKLPLHLILLVIAAIAMALLVGAWRRARSDSRQLAATLAAQNATIQQASQNEKHRDAQLDAALAAIEAAKRTVRTPEQAARSLPEVLAPLPLPISVHIPSLSNKTSGSLAAGPGSRTKPDDSTAAQPPDEKDETSVSIPRPDLIPLYDRLQDCRVAQVQTAALEKDLSDEQARAAALLKERNAAITAARGGSVLQRLAHAAKWFAVGLATGAALARTTHHR